jgi:hypothetical protein
VSDVNAYVRSLRTRVEVAEGVREARSGSTSRRLTLQGKAVLTLAEKRHAVTHRGSKLRPCGEAAGMSSDMHTHSVPSDSNSAMITLPTTSCSSAACRVRGKSALRSNQCARANTLTIIFTDRQAAFRTGRASSDRRPVECDPRYGLVV